MKSFEIAQESLLPWRLKIEIACLVLLKTETEEDDLGKCTSAESR